MSAGKPSLISAFCDNHPSTIPLLRKQQISSTDLNTSPSPSSLPLVCWICGRTGHRKVTCPQITCFYCGKKGHSKRVCLNLRLARIYDDDKYPGLHSSASHKSTIPSDRLQPPSKATMDPESFPHLPHIPTAEKSIMTKDLPECSKTCFDTQKLSTRDLTLTQHDTSNTVTQPLIGQLPLHTHTTESFKGPKDLLEFSQTSVNTQLQHIDDSTLKQENLAHSIARALASQLLPPLPKTHTQHRRQTCQKCPLCNTLFLTRKEALDHVQLQHPQPKDTQLKLNRIKLYSDDGCEKCGLTQNFNLLKLPCNKKLCEECISSTLEGSEVELENHIFDVNFKLFCSFCNKLHQIEPNIGVLIYQLNGRPLPIS